MRNFKVEEKWQAKFGKRLSKIIIREGYSSPYDFWINSDISSVIARSYLNNIINGSVDPRISTLKYLSKALKVELSELLN